jgi:hypothetical protein
MKLTLSMARYPAVALLACTAATLSLATPADAQPVSIPILNPSFDLDVLDGSPGASSNGLTGWITGPNSGVFKASTTQYPEAPSTGVYCAYLGYSSVTGSISQTLGATVQANTTYVLTLGIGARADYPFTGYVASLLAGNVVLASGHKTTPLGGTFVKEVLEYESGAAPAQLGQRLQIRIVSLGEGQVNINGAVLTAAPTTAQ